MHEIAALGQTLASHTKKSWYKLLSITNLLTTCTQLAGYVWILSTPSRHASNAHHSALVATKKSHMQLPNQAPPLSLSNLPAKVGSATHRQLKPSLPTHQPTTVRGAFFLSGARVTYHLKHNQRGGEEGGGEATYANGLPNPHSAALPCHAMPCHAGASQQPSFWVGVLA